MTVEDGPALPLSDVASGSADAALPSPSELSGYGPEPIVSSVAAWLSKELCSEGCGRLPALSEGLTPEVRPSLPLMS